MDSAILIAHADRARAQRIGEACAARGFGTSFASHGAEALEAALSEVPDVLVAPLDLPLIDGRRLVEILRANPRTQEVRFLFLGREPEGEGPGILHEVIAADADPEDVAVRVEAMLAQRARFEAVEKEARADHEVEGRLSQIPLTDLLQLFHMNRRTGCFELSRREPGGREERGTLWIRDGNLIQAVSGRVEGEKALFRILGWRDGTFAFTPSRVTTTTRITTPTRALLLEGVRQLDEWDRMRGSLPPLDAQVTLAVGKGELAGGVHPLTQEVLLLLEIHDLVRDVVDHCSYPDYQVLRTIQTLSERGIVQIRRDPGSAEGRGPALFSPSQVRRLREWLLAGRPRGARLADAKLLVVASDPADTRDFVRVLGGLPGMELAAPFSRGRFDAADVAPIGRLYVGDGLGLELLHVPSDPVFTPVWPVAAHGALGTLLLLSESASPGPGSPLAAVAEALRRMPEGRLFHVWMLRKGERVEAEDLRGHLPLLERSSLFLLPLERARDAIALMRTMLARVMP